MGFGQALMFAHVNQQALLLDDFLDDKLLVRLGFDLVAHAKAHAL